MVHGKKVCCILCGRSEETKMTGPLSTKSDVTAHQNCLLYSSGIYCTESPVFDDLFGFSVDDVREEVKRGKKLKCFGCKKTCATAGCEVKRCARSYHYPCAIEGGAQPIEDAKEGKFGLYCFKHSEAQKNKGSVGGNNTPGMSPTTSNNPSEAGSSEVYCLTCEKKEGNISLESLMNSIKMIYCDKHAPSSHQRNTNGDSSRAGTSAYNSDSNSSSNSTRVSSKRQLGSDEEEEVTPSKRKSKSCRRTISEESSNLGDNPPDSECAPLDDDFAESAPLNGESEQIRTSMERDVALSSGHQQEEENTGGNDEENGDETFEQSDAESESLLGFVEVCVDSLPFSTNDLSTQTECTMTKVIKREQGESSYMPPPSPPPDSDEVVEPSVPQQSSVASPPSPDCSRPQSVTNPPPRTSSSVSPPPPQPPPPSGPTCITISSSPPSPTDSVPSIDSASFWKSCNTAQCTQAIFSDFFKDMNNICVKIQSDQASQEDFDRALAVIEASGKLEELVTKQQRELLRKREELDAAVAAMTEVVSTLRR